MSTKRRRAALALVSVLILAPPTAAGAGHPAVPRPTLSAILQAVETNRGLCCKVAPIKLESVTISPRGRFAVVVTSGGNALDGLTVIAWHGVRRWAVVEYGSDIAGCGFIPGPAIAALFSRAVARECPRQVRNDPFFQGNDGQKIQRTARTDPWLADHDRRERLTELSLLALVRGNESFATIVSRVQTPRGLTTRFGLLRRGTAMWSLIDVREGRGRLGCGLVRGDVRRALRLTGDCST